MPLKHISHVQHIIIISSECPFHTLVAQRVKFQYHYKNCIVVNKKYDFTNYKNKFKKPRIINETRRAPPN